MLLLIVPVHPASAAAPAITGFDLQAAEHLTVGDRFRVEIKVEADRGTIVALAPGGLPAVLSQTSQLETRTRNLGGGRVELRLSFEAAAFAPGDLELPPLRLRYRGPDGAAGELQTPASRLRVESVLPESAVLSPRDLKPQAEVGTAGVGALPVIGLVVALVLLVAFARWRQRRLRARRIVQPEPVPEAVGPEDRARRLLDGAAALLETGDRVPYYETLAGAVRGYLTERFGFPAFALTTTELQERMVRQGMDRWQARLVAGLLSQCDAVVFASYRPATERADADLTAAYEIVEMSRPDEAPREEVAVP